MKKTTLFAFAFAWLLSSAAQAQGFIQIGTPLLEDQGWRMIAISDGSYITAGSAGQKAVLYKTDCLGNLLAQLETPFNTGPAIFWDVIELSDGNLVAVGEAVINVQGDTSRHAILFKTNPALALMASARFSVLDKESAGKSIAQTPSGDLLVWGEVTGFSIDFTDAFFQRLDPTFLQPTTDPVIFNNGVDLASRIIPTADGNYLLTGSSFFGNIFNPEAPIDNILRAHKVDENGVLAWSASVRDTFLAKYGVARSCGAVQSSTTGNFVLGGKLFGGTDEKKQDPFFALIDNSGTVLDTAYIDAPGQQEMFAIVENFGFPGVFTMLGESDGSPLGVPSLAFSQVYELGADLLAFPVSLDPTTPVSFRDAAQIDPGRFAFMGTVPDNPTAFAFTDVVIGTPAVAVELVYQNCALAASMSSPATAFQWLYEGQVIQDANQGVYFPDQPGLYQVQVLDDKGCYGISDTFRVTGPMADFTFVADGLTVTFTNTSTGASNYLWAFGPGTSILTDPTYTFPSSGVYVVSLIARNSCDLRDTVHYTLGLTPANEPSWLGHFVLSPNPTNGAFTVEMSGEPQEKVEFVLFNSVGQLTQREELNFKSGILQKSFDLGLFPSGVYSLQIRSGKEAKNVKVLKQ